jgi:hypothetical protein
MLDAAVRRTTVSQVDTREHAREKTKQRRTLFNVVTGNRAAKTTSILFHGRFLFAALKAAVRVLSVGCLRYTPVEFL